MQCLKPSSCRATKRISGRNSQRFTSKTYNTYSLLRIIVKTQSEQDMKDGIDYLHTLKIYPLTEASSPDPIQFIDVANKPFEAVPVYDASFYTSLARMVSEEIVQDRDLAIMGQLYSLNIGKGSHSTLTPR
jgi:hypothetical protein